MMETTGSTTQSQHEENKYAPLFLYLRSTGADCCSLGFGQSTMFSMRGFLNFATLGTLLAALLMLFAGYPILAWARDHQPAKSGAFKYVP
jgi:hypothetical protein